MNVTMDVVGLEQLKRKLAELPAKVERKVIRKAVNEASKGILKAQKSAVPVDTGTLRRSLGRKVKRSRKTKETYAVVGPRRRFTKVINGRKVTPTKYAHFVRPAFERAFEASKGQAQETMQQTLAEGIASEAK